MSDSAALDSFLEKWRARWPEWSVAEIFVPAERRERAVAWFALLQEFDDALNIAGDPLPADAKLAWWGEELRGWAARRSRHPLGRRLEPIRAPWEQLAEALPALAPARMPTRDGDAAFASLSAFAEAVVAVEADVLGRAAEPGAVIAHTLAIRLMDVGATAVPYDLGASVHGDPARLRAWADHLRDRGGDLRQGARERRILSSFAFGRLLRHARAGQPAPLPSPPRLLFTAWRAVRGG
ncbi:phytoene/squalene synthase family protein [Pseudoxanthomonas putridarboris]|uniref:Phytoene/squalene synthase family protein n=1 Tax=Pseudoxanthomonas putridarboris TaxID=752605 RepID=A0ABU9J1Z9_9GAMM